MLSDTFSWNKAIVDLIELSKKRYINKIMNNIMKKQESFINWIIWIVPA